MKQTHQAQKEQVLDAWTKARRAVLTAVEELPADARETPFLGAWSAHDLVAHLIGWDYANLEGARAVLMGQLPAFYGRYDPDWRRYNAELVAHHRRPTVAESIAAAHTSFEILRAFLETIPADDFVADHGVRSPRGRRVTIAMLLSAEANDEHKHAEQVGEYLNRVGGATDRGDPAGRTG